MTYVLAADGGNTKTLVLVADEDGNIIGQGRSGTSDIYNTEVAQQQRLPAEVFAVMRLEEAVNQAFRMAHIQPADLTASVFNLAGVDWPEDYAYWQEALQARHYGKQILIQNDALGVLAPGTPFECGISVICGTGTATGARGHDGRIWHSSFWQRVHGSRHLSQQTLDAVIEAELGIESPTALTHRVLDFFEQKNIEDVLHMITGRTQPTDDRTDSYRHCLALLLLNATLDGDPLAQRIVVRHGRALGKYAIAAARKVNLTQSVFPLVLAGSLFRHASPLLADAILTCVQEACPQAYAVRSPHEPIIGALFTAFSLHGKTLLPSMQMRMMETYPDAAFFQTTSPTERKQTFQQDGGLYG